MLGLMPSGDCYIPGAGIEMTNLRTTNGGLQRAPPTIHAQLEASQRLLSERRLKSMSRRADTSEYPTLESLETLHQVPLYTLETTVVSLDYSSAVD